MFAVPHALSPIFLLIALGWWLRRRRWVAVEFWSGAESLVYYLLFPALLVTGIGRADFGPYPLGGLAAALLGATAGTGLIALLAGRWLGLNGPALTSLFQGTLRPNTYVGLAAAGALLGKSGAALTALSTAIVIPAVNLLAVLVMLRWGAPAEGQKRPPNALKALVANPLILACGLGALLNVTGIGTPAPFGAVLDILGAAALPLGILAAGAGIDAGAARAQLRAVATTAGLKLLLLPGLTLLACMGLGIEGIVRSAAVLYGCLPVSASAYVLARQMGGDAPLLAGIITATTLGALAVLPLAALMLGALP